MILIFPVASTITHYPPERLKALRGFCGQPTSGLGNRRTGRYKVKQ